LTVLQVERHEDSQREQGKGARHECDRPERVVTLNLLCLCYHSLLRA